MRFLKTLAVVSALLAQLPSATAANFLDWTITPGAGSTPPVYSSTTSAGTITGTTTVPGFGAFPGTFGLPNSITSQPPLTAAFMVGGANALGTSVDFVFSNGFNWGTGGELILANIHNNFEYSVAAWDFSNNSIEVGLWPILAEYDSLSPGVDCSTLAASNSR